MKSILYQKTLNGKFHSCFDPQSEVDYPPASEEIYWMRNGKKHNLENPSVSEYNRNEIIHDYYYYENLYHRMDGPADVGLVFKDYSVSDWYIFGVDVNGIYEEMI